MTKFSIPKVSLTTNGPKLSKLAYGIWRLADVEESPLELLKRVKHCMELGITTFDCADIYGGIDHVCETLLGKAIALAPELRADMEIVTKCGIVCPSDSVHIKHYDLSKNYILKRVNESLTALGTDYIDLLLIHRPSCMMDADQVAAAFRELKDSGKVLHFGVSNFKPFQLTLLQSRLDFPLATNQIELNPLCLDSLHDGTLDQAQELNMSPMVWSPLAGGRLFSTNEDEKCSRVQKVLKSLAARYNVSVDQLIFSWILKHPSKPVIVLGTNKIDRITSAVGAFDCQLTMEDWFSVWEASNGTCVPEGLGKFKQNLSQLRSTSQEVIAEDFAELDAIQWEPIEWHSLLHQLESVDSRIKKITLPTCSVLRMVNNDFLADVLYYFTSYHGQQIIDIVANSMNESYTKFMKQFPDFKGKIAIYAHSLGGIISYDILANQSRTRRNTSRPAHHNVIYPSLKFQPEYLFAIGSPIAAVLVMRAQNFDDYKIMPGTRFFNIFHLYDPIAYRVEPLMGERYENLNPILLQRPSSRNRPTFSYYTEQFASYMASTSFKTQLSEISLKLPSLPTISLPNIPGLELAKETLNKQFSIMIDSITNYSTIFGSINSPPKSLKRKREEEDEAAEGHASSSQYRVIKQPVSHLHKSEEKEANEIDSTESIISPQSTSQTSPLNVAYSTVMQQTVSTVLNRIVTPAIEKIPSISNRSTLTKDLDATGKSSLHRDLNGFSKISPGIMDKRFDYYIQESLIDNNVHQYLLGLRSHFSYWWNKEIHYFIIKNLKTD